MSFTDTSTNSPTSWSWSFDDGGTSTTRNPSHTYAAAGTYTVTLTATNAYGSGTHSASVMVSGGGEYTLPKYGISTGYTILTRSATDRRRELDEIKAVGAQYVRIDLGPGDSAAFDAVLADAESRGLAVMAILYGTTGPVSSGDAQAFAQQQAARLIGRVKMFEFCNEPNTNGWTGTTYAQALIGAYNGLKKGNPDAIMIAGAMGNPGNPAQYLQFPLDMYAAGAKGYFDVFSVHLYEDPDDREPSWNAWDWVFYPSAYSNNTCVRKIMDDNGDDKIPIISTESGLPTVNSSGAPDQYYNETNQATVVDHDFNNLASGQIASFAIYTMMDDDVVGYGLLRSDLSRRSAWETYQTRAK